MAVFLISAVRGLDEAASGWLPAGTPAWAPPALIALLAAAGAWPLRSRGQAAACAAAAGACSIICALALSCGPAGPAAAAAALAPGAFCAAAAGLRRFESPAWTASALAAGGCWLLAAGAGLIGATQGLVCFAAAHLAGRALMALAAGRAALSARREASHG